MSRIIILLSMSNSRIGKGKHQKHRNKKAGDNYNSSTLLRHNVMNILAQ